MVYGTPDDDWISLILYLDTSYPVVVDVVLLKNALQQEISVGEGN